MPRRRRGFIIGGAVVLVVLLAAGGFAAWYFLADDSPPPPKLSDAASAPSGGTPNGQWQLGTGGYVGYRVVEQFAGETLSKDAVGRTSDLDGSMVIANTRIDSAKVTANLKELTSDREPRDTYLHDNALETNTYPTAEFALDAPAALPSPTPPGKVVKVPVTGTLTLHGETHPVSTTLDGRWTDDRIDVVGSIPVQLATWDIDTPKTAVVTAEDHGAIELKLVFHRS